MMDEIAVGEEYNDELEKKRWILMVFIDGKLDRKYKRYDEQEIIDLYYENVREFEDVSADRKKIILEHRRPDRIL